MGDNTQSNQDPLAYWDDLAQTTYDPRSALPRDVPTPQFNALPEHVQAALDAHTQSLINASIFGQYAEPPQGRSAFLEMLAGPDYKEQRDGIVKWYESQQSAGAKLPETNSGHGLPDGAHNPDKTLNKGSRDFQ